MLGQRTSDEDYSKILPSLKRPHMDYLHDFYADTAMFGGGVPATRCGYEFFGAEHVVFATDAPLGPIAPTIKTSRKALGPAGRRATRRSSAGNAERLLNMKFQHDQLGRYFFFFLSIVRRAGDPGKTWVGRWQENCRSELVATSSSWRLLARARVSILAHRAYRDGCSANAWILPMNRSFQSPLPAEAN